MTNQDRAELNHAKIQYAHDLLVQATNSLSDPEQLTHFVIQSLRADDVKERIEDLLTRLDDLYSEILDEENVQTDHCP